MNDSSEHDDNRSLAEQEQIDILADRFEQSFRDGKEPRIERMIEDAPKPIQNRLLAELVEVEIELRIARDDSPSREEYVERFPDHQELINGVFDRLEGEAGTQRTVLLSPRQVDGLDAPEEEDLPEKLGRYEIKGRLGRGGFGVVCLAFDTKLKREVAIKIPRRRWVGSVRQINLLTREAQRAAALKHPGLVAVYDVQQTEDGRPYIVQELIDGMHLRQWAKEKRPSFEQLAKTIAEITESVGYAHLEGVTHCDLKLANVLLDKNGQTHVTDFGLAMHESEQRQRRGEVAGTPETMAPEQVRGESHRLDGRTDIWALGSMLYELLTQRRPFLGEDRKDVYQDILNHDPRPPRQIDANIPKALERICMRCLEKRRTDRYQTMSDLRDDLVSWYSTQQSSDAPAGNPVQSDGDFDSSDRSSWPLQVIPKGLRSFDADDQEFFLELLPGPRDRNGIPDSIRFWNQRIENRDADQTFSLGLMYGPSGCGKSSMVKAGLLPLLTDDVSPIYIEATVEDTEVRLLRQLRKHCDLAIGDSLVDACIQLRTKRNRHQPKTLIVIDQFEQWLQGREDFASCQLVDALRHCDGGNLQAIFLVRDDFYLSVNRLFQELEVPLVEGANLRLVDLFDTKHARKVLIAYGSAFGRIEGKPTPENEAFLTHAIDELAVDGRIICVRLALFAEMMKGRAWDSRSLQTVGGVEGLGARFLEETFSASTASPTHRSHEKAARLALESLLPETGTDLKGAMQSRKELQATAGYADQGKRFAELIRILDDEVRLITPSDPDGEEAADGQGFFQLTHDFLVPSLRDWLTRKRRETRRGRAELQLADRSALWSLKKESRHLPSLVETLNYLFLTTRKSWNSQEREMMEKAIRWNGQIWGAVAVLIIVATGIILALLKASAHESLLVQIDASVSSLQNNSGTAIPILIEELGEFPEELVKEELSSHLDATKQPKRQLALAYGLASLGDVRHEILIDAIPNASSDEFSNIAMALGHDQDAAVTAMHAAAAELDQPSDWRAKARLALLELELGASSIADSMSSKDAAPAVTASLIEETIHWYRPSEKYESIVKNAQNARTQAILALAGTREFDSSNEFEPSREWIDQLEEWYQAHPSAYMHSVAGYALSKHGRELPDLPNTEPSTDREWFVRDGICMMRVSNENATIHGSPSDPPQTFDEFYIASMEISYGSFQDFLNDHTYASEEKPENWVDMAPMLSPSGDYPAQQVSFYDAILYCNWLNHQLGLPPCYVRTGETEVVQEVSGTNVMDVTRDVWELRDDRKGFRLPSQSQWETACRGRSGRQYCFGNDSNLIAQYASVYPVNAPKPRGKLLPNLLGLHNLHGNVGEWCWDRSVKLFSVGGEQRNLPARVIRGGYYSSSPKDCGSMARANWQPTIRTISIGFRVVWQDEDR